MSPEIAALVCRFCDGETLNVRAELAALEPPLSKSAFYRYVSRFRAAGVDGLYPASRRPLTSPGGLAAAVEEGVVLARKELSDSGWDAGADQILFWLDDHRDRWCDAIESSIPALPSRASVNRILKRRGLVIAMPQRAPRKPRRFEYDQPNTMWQMDGFEVALDNGDKVVVIHIVDDCSRVDIALDAARSENAAEVWASVTKAAATYGLPRMMLTDNGTAFSGRRRGWTSALEENLAELGVRHIAASVAHPQTCGKCERAHQPVLRWLAKQTIQPSNLAHLQDLLDTYRHFNNHQRRRTHLNGITPMLRYQLGPKDGPGAGPLQLPAHIADRIVSSRGCVGLGNTMVGIGRRYAGQTVQVIRQGDKTVIISGHTMIASFILDRTKRYQSANPRPPGPPPGKLSPMS